MRQGSHEVFQPPLPVGRLWARSKLGERLRGGDGKNEARRDVGTGPQQGPLHMHHRAHLQTRAWASTAEQDGDPRTGSTSAAPPQGA